MQLFQAEISNAIRDETITIVLNIRNMLISEPPEGTPVDTGFATNNWWFNEGSPANSPREPGPGGDQRIQADTTRIASYTLNGQTLHITNNANYIGILNDGSSSQTPRGFIERAILTEQFASRARVAGLRRGRPS